MRRSLAWTLALAVLIVATTAFLALRPSSASRKPASGTLVEVARGTVQRLIPLAGFVVSREEASVTYTGRSTTVATLDVAPGDSVATGTTLATMANGAKLTAPFSGTVVAVTLSPGAFVPSAPPAGTQGAGSGAGGGRPGAASAGQSVSPTATGGAITIARVAAVEVRATVSQMDAHWIKAGQPVRMVIPGEPGVVYEGKVTALDPVAIASGSTEAYPVSISLPVPSGAPRPWLGMSVQAYVKVASERGLTVPVSAVSVTPSGEDRVRLASGRWQTVRIGLIGTERVVVRAGLETGVSVQVPRAQGGNRSVRVEVLQAGRPAF